MRKFIYILVVWSAVVVAFCQSYSIYNWTDRRAIVANVCPHMKISRFSFGNLSDRFATDYAWENVSDKDIIAFEIVVLRYDPFNRPIIGLAAIFPGHNSATYESLKPGEKSSDGGRTIGNDKVFTAVAYIRNIRFSDGSVWTASAADVIKSIKTQVPDILEIGSIVPEKKKEDGS